MYRFRPMVADDLPLVRGWLEQSHVSTWWGEPDEQFGLVQGDLDHPAMDQYVVSLDDRPFAYVQSYLISEWDAGFGAQPEGTRGLDQFIGELDMMSQGHGSAMLRIFSDQLLASGTPRVVTDPDPGNRRAIRAYEKAGFVRDRLVDTPDGVALLMVRDR